MPFTISHAAAAWPIRFASRGRLRLAAIAIGAMAPDFVYFPRLATKGEFGHTLPGLFLFCLPVGWLALWLFDRFGVRGLNALAPAQWQRPTPSRRYPALRTSLALLVGAASHVAWDSVTHADGLVVRALPALAVPFTLGPYAGPAFKLFQHASTVIGLTVLALAVARFARTRPPVSAGELARRAAVPLAVVGGAGLLNGLRVAERGVMAFSVAAGVAVALTVCIGPVVVGALPRREEP